MKAKLKSQQVGRDGSKLVAGTVIEGPDAWKLVASGIAVPDDDECRIKCGERKATAKASKATKDADES